MDKSSSQVEENSCWQFSWIDKFFTAATVDRSCCCCPPTFSKAVHQTFTKTVRQTFSMAVHQTFSKAVHQTVGDSCPPSPGVDFWTLLTSSHGWTMNFSLIPNFLGIQKKITALELVLWWNSNVTKLVTDGTSQTLCWYNLGEQFWVNLTFQF